MSEYQEIFTQVVKGLASQGWKKALDHQHRCAYRGKDGLKCAAGWLITDDEYYPGLEGSDIDDLVGSQEIPSLKNLPKSGLVFIRLLQRLHDESLGSMENNFKEFADNNSLAWPENI